MEKINQNVSQSMNYGSSLAIFLLLFLVCFLFLFLFFRKIKVSEYHTRSSYPGRAILSGSFKGTTNAALLRLSRTHPISLKELTLSSWLPIYSTVPQLPSREPSWTISPPSLLRQFNQTPDYLCTWEVPATAAKFGLCSCLNDQLVSWCISPISNDHTYSDLNF